MNLRRPASSVIARSVALACLVGPPLGADLCPAGQSAPPAATASGAEVAPRPTASGEPGTDLDGTWILTRYVAQGKDSPETVAQHYTIHRLQGVQMILKGDEPFAARRVVLDAKTDPKRVDFTNLATGATTRGIYRVDGDRLVVVMLADAERSRAEYPTTFEPGDANVVAEYTRKPAGK